MDILETGQVMVKQTLESVRTPLVSMLLRGELLVAKGLKHLTTEVVGGTTSFFPGRVFVIQSLCLPFQQEKALTLYQPMTHICVMSSHEPIRIYM